MRSVGVGTIVMRPVCKLLETNRTMELAQCEISNETLFLEVIICLAIVDIALFVL